MFFVSFSETSLEMMSKRHNEVNFTMIFFF
jgi:hypothetical protein